MKKLFAAVVAPVVIMVAALPVLSAPAQAQNLNEVFRRANPSVVVIRAKGRDVSSVGVTRFSETGSGVLVSADGKVMTVAHTVNAMDEISVEALGGEPVSAKIIASEPAADLSLLQLERVPPSMRAATMADSSAVRVGDQVIVIGAPYGLAHSIWSGIDGTMLTGDLAAIFNVPEPSGFLVKTVAQGSSAWDMGLLGGDKIATIAGQQIAVGGDIILAVDGIAVGSDDNIEKIRNKLAAEPPGTPFKMKALRAGKVIELTGKTQ